MKQELRPTGITTPNTFFDVLHQYIYRLDVPQVPKDLKPFLSQDRKLDRVFDNRERLKQTDGGLGFLSPERIDRRLEIIKTVSKEKTKTESTTHFGITYDAVTSVYYSHQHGHPLARVTTYNKKEPNGFYNPAYTMELIGFNPDTGKMLSIAVTSYEMNQESLLVYTSFEDGIGVQIDIGAPKLSESFVKILRKTFLL